MYKIMKNNNEVAFYVVWSIYNDKWIIIDPDNMEMFYVPQNYLSVESDDVKELDEKDKIFLKQKGLKDEDINTHCWGSINTRFIANIHTSYKPWAYSYYEYNKYAFTDSNYIEYYGSNIQTVNLEDCDIAISLLDVRSDEKIITLPTPDLQPPQLSFEDILTLYEYIVKNYKKVVVFCSGGVGRTGTMLALLCLCAGIVFNKDGIMYEIKDGFKAIEFIRTNYMYYAIESDMQERYIIDFGNFLKFSNRRIINDKNKK